MKITDLIALLLLLLMCFVIEKVQASNGELSISASESLFVKTWRHGSEDCQSNSEPAIEVFAANSTSYILRQSKCLSYEAPFMYLLVGDNKSLLLDTGAHSDELQFPLYKNIKQLLNELGKDDTHKLLVMHSHSHKDHYGNDEQFLNKANITLVSPKRENLANYINLADDNTPFSQIGLGSRTITVLPTPGHQEEAITLYDSHSQWLLTGDSLYPGLIYVKDWLSYKKSIALLAEFSQSVAVSAILGGHIEMKTQANHYYEIGSLYQPNERPLALATTDLEKLNQQLSDSISPQALELNKFIIRPMNGLQKSLSNVFRWLSQ